MKDHDENEEIHVNGHKPTHDSTYPKTIFIEEILDDEKKKQEQQQQRAKSVRKKNLLFYHIYLRIFLLFLTLFLALYLVVSIIGFVITALCNVLTLFLNIKLRQRLKIFWMHMKGGVLSIFGSLLAFISPKLGLAIVVAFLVGKNEKGFQHLHTHLRNVSDKI